MQKGKLYLIPSTLGDDSSQSIFPEYTYSLVTELRHYIVENEKTARKFIKFINPKVPQGELQIRVISKHSDTLNDIEYITEDLVNGKAVGLLSEAGAPCIADPGAKIVNWAHRNDIVVKPMVGPSAIFLALMASGFNGQNFQFHGYLPKDASSKKKKVQILEKESKDWNKTQLFMETPYRNEELITLLLNTLNPNTQLCIACDISLPSELIATMTIEKWKKTKSLDYNKRPCIFAIYQQF